MLVRLLHLDAGRRRFGSATEQSIVGGLPDAAPFWDAARLDSVDVPRRRTRRIMWSVRTDDHRNVAAMSAAILLSFYVYAFMLVDPSRQLQELLDEVPDEVLGTVIRLPDEKHRPPLTPYDLVDMLAKTGVSTFAAQIRQLLRFAAT